MVFDFLSIPEKGLLEDDTEDEEVEVEVEAVVEVIDEDFDREWKKLSRDSFCRCVSMMGGKERKEKKIRRKFRECV